MNQKAFYLVAMNFLIAIAGGLTQQLQSDLSSGTTRLQPHVLYVKKEIKGGGKQQILTANTKTLPGVCSYDQGGIMETKRAFVFDKIAIDYATNAASGLEGELEYNTKAPKELQNADVIISQNGKELLKLPFRQLHNIETGQRGSDEYTELSTLIGFVDSQPIKIELEFPENVSLDDAVKHYIFVRFDGLQTVVNS